MPLEVLHREQHQVIGIYEGVCLAVRWAVFIEADALAYRRAFAKLQRRCPAGMAFLNVNRFIPAKTVGMDDAAQSAMFGVLSTYGATIRIVALLLPDSPFVAASLRSTYARMANTAKIRLNVRLFFEQAEAVSAVCETLNSAGLPRLHPVDLAAALEELELQRLSPIGSTR